MKKLFLILALTSGFASEAQYYQFSKSVGTYSDLTAPVIVANGNWTSLKQGIKMPFTLNYWGFDIIDSIYLSDYGTVSVNISHADEMAILYEDMNSRGPGRSVVSYKVEGASPARIMKLEYRNIGFDSDAPAFTDSANVQCWLYETSNIIEFRYGPNRVKPTTWEGSGAFVGIIDQAGANFIILQSNPANPTVNTTNIANSMPLVGMPVDGTIYRFTPSQFHTGINNASLKVNLVRNKISLPATLNIISLTLLNMNGQIMRSATDPESLELSDLPPGIYLLNIVTTDGTLSRKVIF